MNDTLDVRPPTPATPEPVAEPDATALTSWRVELDSGLRLHVPPRLDSISTYVLLEQQAWFEDEPAFLPRLLSAGDLMLDIGAHLGVVALGAAHAVPGLRVVAVEPARQTFELLGKSVIDNGLADRVWLARLAMGEAAGPRWLSHGAQPELNRLAPTDAAPGADGEPVRCTALDDFLDRNLPGEAVSLLKLDVQGDEGAVLQGARRLLERGSPIVLFAAESAGEAGSASRTLEALGYSLFRLMPELGLLVPLARHPAGRREALNLFALRPDRIAALAARGLAVDDTLPPAGPTPVLESLEAVAEALLGLRRHSTEPASAASARLRLDTALAAWQAGRRLVADRTDAGAIATVIHAHHLTGQRGLAAELTARLLRHWPSAQAAVGDVQAPWLSPQGEPLSAASMADEPAALSRWLRLQCEAFLESQRAWSSCFAPADPFTLRRLLRQSGHPLFLERRYALGEFRQNRQPDAALVQALREADGPNAAMWRAVLDAPL